MRRHRSGIGYAVFVGLVYGLVIIATVKGCERFMDWREASASTPSMTLGNKREIS